MDGYRASSAIGVVCPVRVCAPVPLITTFPYPAQPYDKVSRLPFACIAPPLSDKSTSFLEPIDSKVRVPFTVNIPELSIIPTGPLQQASAKNIDCKKLAIRSFHK